MLSEHSGGFRESHADSFRHCYLLTLVAYRLDFPDGLVLSVLSLWYLLLHHLWSSFSFYWKGNGNLFFTFPFCFFDKSCLKLHESPREHCPFEVHRVQSPVVRSLLVSFPLNLDFRWGSLSKLLPFEGTCLRCRQLCLFFLRYTDRRNISYSREHTAASVFCTVHNAIRYFNSSEYWSCFYITCPTCIHQELFFMERSTSSHMVSKRRTLSFCN